MEPAKHAHVGPLDEVIEERAAPHQRPMPQHNLLRSRSLQQAPSSGELLVIQADGES